MTTATKHTGTVKFFGDKGFGFIVPDAGDKDMFVHVSAVGLACLRDLKAGDRLESSIEIDGRNGKPCAADLRLI